MFHGSQYFRPVKIGSGVNRITIEWGDKKWTSVKFFTKSHFLNIHHAPLIIGFIRKNIV